MMKLYWCPRSRSFSALWLMEEVGEPYERVLIDITTGAQKKPDYLAINPMGKVPALVDGDVSMAESAAICAYVAERHHDNAPEVKAWKAAHGAYHKAIFAWGDDNALAEELPEAAARLRGKKGG